MGQEGEQCIFRKERRENWTTVDNAIFDTEKLSLGAIGLACLILSKPATWQVKIDYLAHVCREGEKAIRAYLKELAVAGYMMRVRKHDRDGKLRTVTLIADYPRYIDQGTPEDRINGYELPAPEDKETDLPLEGRSVELSTSGTDATDLPSEATSVNQAICDHQAGEPTFLQGTSRFTDLPPAEMSVEDISLTDTSLRGDVRGGEVIVSTDQEDTDQKETKKRKDLSSSSSRDASEPKDDDEVLAVFTAWKENIKQDLVPVLQQELRQLVTDCGGTSVIHGIVTGVKRGSPNFGYIATCARNHAAGIESPPRGAPTSGSLYSLPPAEPRRSYQPPDYAQPLPIYDPTGPEGAETP